MLSKNIVMIKPKHKNNNTSGKKVKIPSQILVEDFMMQDLNEMFKLLKIFGKKKG